MISGNFRMGGIVSPVKAGLCGWRQEVALAIYGQWACSQWACPLIIDPPLPILLLSDVLLS